MQIESRPGHRLAITVAAMPGVVPPEVEQALARRGVRLEVFTLPSNGQANGTAAIPRSSTLAVALIDAARLPAAPDALRALLDQVRERVAATIVVGTPPAEVSELVADAVDGWLPLPLADLPLRTALRTVLQAAALRAELAATRHQLALKETETQSLYEVGAALAAEHDINRLQDLILRRCRELTIADAGSLYLVDERVEKAGEKTRYLRFEISHNDSIPSSYSRFEVPMTKESISGYVALTGETLNLPDVYQLPAEAPFEFNPTFDRRMGYRTKSMLVVPLRDYDNQIVGVIQLINRKRSWDTVLATPEVVEHEAVPFPPEAEQVLGAFAGQAASALNNRLLLDSIEKLFEGFVTASVTAIESRDPTTAGHSGRVAELSVGIAAEVSEIAVGRWKDVRFNDLQLREIRYAGVLHDFGKIGVREHVLLKAKKLTEEQFAVVRSRFAFARKAVETEYSRRQVGVLLERGREAFLAELGPMEAEFRDRVRQMDEDLAAILAANEPTVLDEDHAGHLANIVTRSYLDPDGAERPFLEAGELLALSVRRGSLTEDERRHIESHVQQTYNFLKVMPWTRQLKQVPLIAWAHHEKLDGTGYPQGLQAAEIPIQSRMMTIADIYDALTTSDRPYKRAVPTPKALDILNDEAHAGKLDADLLDVFIQRRVYELTAPERLPSGLVIARP